MTSEMFAIKNLKYGYGGTEFINIPELTILRSEIFCIVGSSGAGKSTLLRLLNLLESPWSGEIVFDGAQVTPASNVLKLRRKMSMVFQEPLLFKTSVFENVAYGLKLRRLNRATVQKRVSEMLERVQLADLAKRKASKLSGGEAQRIAFARALVIEPETIFLDEPFGSLDALTKKDLKTELKQLLKEMRVTAIYVTHDQAEAMEMADRIAVMEDGRILQIGTPDQVFYRPADEFVAKFVGVDTIISGKVMNQEEGLAEIEAHGLLFQAVSNARVGAEVAVCIRPEDVTIMLPADGEKASARNHFSAKIAEIENLGAVSKIALDCGFTLTAAITKRSLEDLCLMKGQTVVATFKATAVHVIEK
jgi:tungstate transport system ATP-binding protein